jgi:hypothetical protein
MHDATGVAPLTKISWAPVDADDHRNRFHFSVSAFPLDSVPF